MQQDRTTDNPALDDALVQCLRIFARHGRKVRADRQAVGRQQKNAEKENTLEAKTTNYKSS
ncbi:MAG: hypothetical protein ISR59_08620 [Anaerolineales bacterium]|nr:hypothetical protein [Anaerolineales bacterium]